ncbi:MAG: hypothetical protein JST16_00695 [Bdellovibrionales bacterium]|nr:hypothetical protein [Bdellovibrionales bacterium]
MARQLRGKAGDGVALLHQLEQHMQAHRGRLQPQLSEGTVEAHITALRDGAAPTVVDVRALEEMTNRCVNLDIHACDSDRVLQLFLLLTGG